MKIIVYDRFRDEWNGYDLVRQWGQDLQSTENEVSDSCLQRTRFPYTSNGRAGYHAHFRSIKEF